MNINQLKNNIRKKKEFNPFHKDFDFVLISKLHVELTNEDDSVDEEISSLLYSLLKCHKYYHEFSTYITQVKNTTKLNFASIIEVCMSIANANFTNVQENILKSASDTLTPLSIKEYKVKSLDPAVEDIDAISVLESQIDDLNIVINYFRHFADELTGVSLRDIESNQIETEESSQIARTILYSSISNTIRSEFEETIWNGGMITYDSKKKHLLFHKNEVDLAILTAGLVRQTSLISQAIMIADDSVEIMRLIETTEQKSNLLKINRINLSSGEVSIKLGNGNEQKFYSIFLSNFSAVSVFSGFMIDVCLPIGKDLTVRDCISFMSHLQLLFNEISNALNEKFKNERFIKFGDMPNRISKQNLIKYLKDKVGNQEEKIEVFLGLISSKIDQRISLWKTSLLEFEDFYYYPFLPNISPNICYVIDELVEKSGYELEQRGILFEKHIRNYTTYHLNNLKYNYRLIKPQKLKHENGEYEEIDMIIELKSKILVFEIKCIKYSFFSRDFHNTKKILIHATKQLNRKINFIKKHKGIFHNERLEVEEKQICGAVITQFPIFTGQKFNEIPIIDFPIFQSYISSGEYSSVTIKKGKENITNINRTLYYKDEDSFNANFEDYLSHPFPIQSLLKNVKMKFDRISSSNDKTILFAKRAFIDDNYLKDCFTNDDNRDTPSNIV